jgi:hypothetical protein
MPGRALPELFDAPMNRTVARWVAFISAFVSGLLALQVALTLGLFAWNGEPGAVSDLAAQSREAAIAALAAIVSAIAQVIGKASQSDKG